MIAHTAKVMPILSSVLVLIGFFLTLCVGINLGDIPRGLRHPRDVPSVDPSTLVRKTLYALASLKYCYNASEDKKRLNKGNFREKGNFKIGEEANF